MRKKIIIILALLVLVSFATYLKLHQSFQLIGTLEGTQIDLSAQVLSTISEILVQEGDAVKKNQPLVKFKCDELRLEHQQAERDFHRISGLFNKGITSSENYEKVKTQKEIVSIKYGWCEIKSPVDARVNSQLKELGELVSPGQKVISLIQLNKLYAWLYISQKQLPDFTLGQNLTFNLSDIQKKMEGTLVKINDEAEFTPKNVQTLSEKDRLVYGMKVEFENADGILKPGMSVELIND